MKIDRTSRLAGRASALSANVPVRRGRITLRAASPGGDEYYLFWPLRELAGLPMLVAVHGISINAREQARVFAPLAEKLGLLGA